MQSFLEKLFYDYAKERNFNESVKMIEAEIEMNEKCLKKKFNRKQKKLLLKIVDAKDLIKEESTLASFITGFKIGLEVGYESNKY